MELFCISIVAVVTQIYECVKSHKTDIKRKKSILMYANVKLKN